MTISDYPIPVRPFAVVDSRIIAAQATGKLLEGLQYDREAKLSPLGEDMLPWVQPLSYSYDEHIFAGAPAHPEQVGNTPVVAQGTITLFVAARREYGLCQRSTSDGSGKGALEWISRLQDAIETKAGTTAPDSFLDGTLAKPITFKVKENYISDLAFVLQVELSIFTVPYYRSGRTR